MVARLISKNSVVFLRLSVRDASGEELENNFDGDAFTYIHGQGVILPKLEEALEGKKVGDHIEITLAAEEAYGPYLKNALITIARSQLDNDIETKVGTGIRVDGPEGMIELYIKEINNHEVLLDANHPYAGKSLAFSIDILAIREAHHDEIWHRRVHPGGHHLMVTDSSFEGD